MLMAMAITSASVINPIYFGKKPLLFLLYAFTMVLCSEIACSQCGRLIGGLFTVCLFCLFFCYVYCCNKNARGREFIRN